jgi:hypothetical protein
MRQNAEYNMQMHKYYRQWKEQRDAERAQEWEVLQVSMIMNNQFSDNWILYLYY